LDGEKFQKSALGGVVILEFKTQNLILSQFGGSTSIREVEPPG